MIWLFLSLSFCSISPYLSIYDLIYFCIRLIQVVFPSGLWCRTLLPFLCTFPISLHLSQSHLSSEDAWGQSFSHQVPEWHSTVLLCNKPLCLSEFLTLSCVLNAINQCKTHVTFFSSMIFFPSLMVLFLSQYNLSSWVFSMGDVMIWLTTFYGKHLC